MERLALRLITIGLLLIGLIFIGFFGCGGNGDTAGDDSMNDDIGKDAEVSDCGGFNGGNVESVKSDGDDEYCRDEKLVWEYDSGTQTAIFVNENVWLNCCGEHSIEIIFDEQFGVFEIKETDEPLIIEGEETRCLCMCFFDFKISLPDVAGETISIKLTRDITDDSDPRYTVWEGGIDLSENTGEVIIEEDVGDCGE